jgi:hypothetical protein
MSPARSDDPETKVRRLVETFRRSPEGFDAHLSQLTADDIVALCRLVQREAEGGRRRALFAYLYYGSFIALLWFCWHPTPAPGASPDTFDAPVVLTLLATILFGYGSMHRDWATMLLARLPDIHAIGAIGPLLDAQSDDPSISMTIREILTPLLPRLRASDAALLEPRHLALLGDDLCHSARRAGTSSGHARYDLAILKALEQVGDETCIPYVERAIRTARNPNVRAAAEPCLPFLQTRAQIGKHTLLRPANEPGRPSETLLRPAAGAQEAGPEQLLRPSRGTPPQL